jgi:hypothetical protein
LNIAQQGAQHVFALQCPKVLGVRRRNIHRDVGSNGVDFFQADDIIIGISNVSFSITVPTNDNEQVPYKVDFRDISAMTVII